MKMFLRVIQFTLVVFHACDALSFQSHPNSSISVNTSGVRKLVTANRTVLSTNKSGAKKLAANRTSLLVSKPATFQSHPNSSISVNTSGVKKPVTANRTLLSANTSRAKKLLAANRTSLLVSKPATFQSHTNSSISVNTSGVKKLVTTNRTVLSANKSGAKKLLAANRTSLLVSMPATSSQDLEVEVPVPMNETATMFVVEVPVVEVVMVDNSSAKAKMSQQTSSSDFSAQCQTELERLSASRSRVQRAETCEQQNKLSEQAVTALQQGNLSGATDAIERGFFECGKLSTKCSEEMAPEVVLKLRLTGVTVTKQCIHKAQAMQGKKATKADQVCQDNVTKSMISQLSHRNLNGAMSAAEYGLRTCQDIQHPCDFQLAPVLVASLLEQSMEEEMVEVMLTGIAAAQEMSKKLQQSSGKVNATQQGSQKNHTTRKHVLATPLKNQKAISLLSIAQHVRIGVAVRKFTH